MNKLGLSLIERLFGDSLREAVTDAADEHVKPVISNAGERFSEKLRDLKAQAKDTETGLDDDALLVALDLGKHTGVTLTKAFTDAINFDNIPEAEGG